MSRPRMTLRTALPGLAAGSAGGAAGLFGLALHQPALAAVAGVLALVAGLASLRVASQLEDQMAMHAIVETGLHANRFRAERADGLMATELGQAAAGPASGRTGTDGAGSGTDGPRSPGFDGAAPEFDPATATGAGPAAGAGAGAATGAAAGAGADELASAGAGAGPNGDDTLVDKATGLFSETFFRVALESRIAAARRHLRPVSVVLLEVVEGLPAGGPLPVDADMVSTVIKATLREADTACRLRSGYFALLLEDTPENGAIWTVERMRRGLADMRQGLTMWAGVACYPAHAFNPEEILTASERALVAAREWRQDRIEVAVAAD